MATDQLETLVTGRIAELTKANEQLQAELVWDWDVQTGEIYFSPEWKAQIGYEDDELKNRLGEY